MRESVVYTKQNLQKSTGLTFGLDKPNYQRDVSIIRPSGYEPDALPLRHPDKTPDVGLEPTTTR